MKRKAIRPEYPPSLFNLDAEAEIIGAVMLDNRAIHTVLEILDIEDLYEPLHQRILYEIQVMVADGKTANPVTLRPLFVNDPAIIDLGGPAYLARLTEEVAFGMIGTRDCARQIADLAARRRMYDVMVEKTEAIADVAAEKLSDVTTGLDVAIAKAVSRRQVGSTLSLADAVDKTWKAIEENAAGQRPRGAETDFVPDWNDLTGTMRPGEMIILGARPSMGKTATATSVALGSARRGHGVLFISLEMDYESITERMMADLMHWEKASTTYNDIQAGNIDLYNRDAFARMRVNIRDWPLIITDPSTLSARQLPMLVRRYQREMEAKGRKLELVIVDYLQLMKGEKGQDRYALVTDASQMSKQTAKECGVAMLVLSQLSRGLEAREDKRPTLSDLRESGQIEQDADTVMFLHREEYYLERSKPKAPNKLAEWEIAMQAAAGKMDIICAKRRKGRIGSRECNFIAEHQAVRGSKFHHHIEQEIY